MTSLRKTGRNGHAHNKKNSISILLGLHWYFGDSSAQYPAAWVADIPWGGSAHTFCPA